MKLQKTLIMVALMAFLAVFANAQATKAQINGKVTVEDGSPVPGVLVTATSPRMVGSATAVTDENGNFRLLGLTPGLFQLKFELEGFQPVIRKDVQLNLEQTLSVNATMQLAKITEAMTIVGDAPLIDVKSSARGMALTKEVFSALPKGRNFDSLVATIPGVSVEPLLGGTMVDGASGLENSYYIDGADTTNLTNGRAGQSAAFEFVEEVQVKTSGYQAEFGGSLGGVINVVTRSGGNEFHGEVLGYYSGSSLRSDYSQLLDLDDQDTSKAKLYDYTYYYGTPKEHRIEAGFNLGGYIAKDKLWFFGTFLPIYFTNTLNLTHADGVTKDWKRTENNWNFQFKLSAQPMKDLRLSASVVNNFYKYKGALSTFFGPSSPAVNNDDIGFSYPNMSGNFTADLTLGNNLMLGARFGYFKTDKNTQLAAGEGPCFQFITEAPGGYFKTTNIGLLDVPAAYQKAAGYYNYSRSISQNCLKNINNRWSVNADLNYFMSLGGEHSWKLGGQFVRQGQDYDNIANNPVLFFGWNRDFVAYGVNYGRGKYGYYGVRSNDVTGAYGDYYKANSNRMAIYLQDSWTISTKFTVNFGLRTESEYIPNYATGRPEFDHIDKVVEWGFGDKLAPRLGFVYDVKGDSSFKIFGSMGWFFDVMKLEMPAGSYGGTRWKSAYYSLDTYEWDKIGVNNYFPGTLLLPGKTFDFRATSFDSTDPDMKPMSQREMSLGFEKKLMENVALSVRYVNKKLLWAIEDIGVLLADGEHYYTTNPGGDFIIEKFAEGRAAGVLLPGVPDCPKALRNYNGLNLALDKRFSNNWMGGFSYTYSTLKGNYNGLASGDEAGRTNPNVERYFDLWYLAYDRDLNMINGNLPGDRPHAFKVYGSYMFPFGLTVGTVINAMSGQPVSTEWAMDVQGYLPYGRGDLGRTPFMTIANLYLDYNLKLGKNKLNFSVNVDNLLNTRTATRIYQIYNQGGVSVTDADILAGGWNINDPKYAEDLVLDPRFGQGTDFYGGYNTTYGIYIGSPLAVRLGIKYIF